MKEIKTSRTTEYETVADVTLSDVTEHKDPGATVELYVSKYSRSNYANKNVKIWGEKKEEKTKDK